MLVPADGVTSASCLNVGKGCNAMMVCRCDSAQRLLTAPGCPCRCHAGCRAGSSCRPWSSCGAAAGPDVQRCALLAAAAHAAGAPGPPSQPFPVAPPCSFPAFCSRPAQVWSPTLLLPRCTDPYESLSGSPQTSAPSCVLQISTPPAAMSPGARPISPAYVPGVHALLGRVYAPYAKIAQFSGEPMLDVCALIRYPSAAVLIC